MKIDEEVLPAKFQSFITSEIKRILREFAKLGNDAELLADSPTLQKPDDKNEVELHETQKQEEANLHTVTSSDGSLSSSNRRNSGASEGKPVDHFDYEAIKGQVFNNH